MASDLCYKGSGERQALGRCQGSCVPRQPQEGSYCQEEGECGDFWTAHGPYLDVWTLRATQCCGEEISHELCPTM